MSDPRVPSDRVLLEELSPGERDSRFDALNGGCPTYGGSWASMSPGSPWSSSPSVSLDRIDERGGTLVQAYEERFLFLLLLLRQPRLRMVYVTSMPIAPTVIEYYLALLPGVIPSHARSRLHLVHVGDASGLPLTDKLLARPRLLAHISALVPDRRRSHLIPYNTTDRERDLALALGIPMYGADPRLYPLGRSPGAAGCSPRRACATPWPSRT